MTGGPTQDEVEALIRADNLHYDPSAKPKPKPGLKVFPGPQGVYVAAFNKDGRQVRFNQAQQDWLNRTLPVLYPGTSPAGALFGRESERERQLIGLRSRLQTVRQGEQDGRYGVIESLDPNPDRTVPTLDRLRDMDQRQRGTLPNVVTFVQFEPPPPRRYIAMSEFSMKVGSKRVRPDEVFVSYVLDAGELEAVTGPEPKKFAELKPIKAHNLSVHVADLNTELGEGRARKHFEKTSTCLVETLRHLETEWGIEPEGKVRLSSRDTYLQSAMVKLGEAAGDKSGASVARWRKMMKAMGELLGETSVIHVSMEVEREVDPGTGRKGKWTISRPDVSVIGRLGNTVLDSAVRNLVDNDVVPRIRQFFLRR
jgi:hypothetical protein